ncbi:hypothetical protein [Gellertiella hungarica]|uniref:Uncharacterized protein n=1 Tax=Gellertiella hungarica TaxID=1572859 RepID=A0A7W6J8J8_9HYPH|nr:hypothetical protein [Gellertiella hungarica]MBB4066764.1 hypothetical protein [Gellertiella hungarica]
MTEEKKMRAKVRVGSVTPVQLHEGRVVQERLVFHGVAKKTPYGADGHDEDNTFARYSPSVNFDMMVMNPALIGTFTPGDTFYVDFIPTEQ